MKTTAERAGGWGDAGPDGLITGGEGGDILYFNESSSVNGKTGFNALWETIALNLTTPLQLFWTGGDIILDPINYVIGQTNSFVNRPIDKSIIGTNGQVLTGGSIIPVGWRNIIVRNFIRRGDELGGDNNIPHGGKGFGFRFCERIWIDHCEIDGEATLPGTEKIKDGSLDIYRQSRWVTVSNCYIRRSNKTALHGESDTYTDDEGKLQITYRNCLFENNHTRQPFVRFGQVHLLNCAFRYVPIFTNSATQYDWARIIELGFKAQIYSQGCVYQGHRYFLLDARWAEGEASLSGFVSDGDFYDPSPTFSSFTNGAGDQYKGYGSLRPNRVLFNPNTIENYDYPVPLQTTEASIINYLEQWAGAKYHLIGNNNFSLTVTNTTGGTVSRNPASGSITAGTSVTVISTPATGYTFSKWTPASDPNNVLSANQSYTFNMPTLNLSIQAHFLAIPDPEEPIPPVENKKIRIRFPNNLT